MELESVFKKINFVARYQNICTNHNDFDKSMSGGNKKMYMEKIKIFDSSVIYLSKDKMFKISFALHDYSLDLGLSLHNGLVEARLFYIKNSKWLIYNRFDGIAEELQEGFRDHFTIPKYCSETELESILKDIFSIYEDVKKEVIRSKT